MLALRAVCRAASRPLSCHARSVAMVPRRQRSTSAAHEAPASGPLPDEIVEAFHRDGWVVAPDFLTASEKEQMVRWTNEVQAWPETAGKWMQYFEQLEGRKQLCRTENFLDYHEGLRQLIDERIKGAVTQLLGEQAVLFKEKINFKLPGGQGFLPHQDQPAWITFDQTYFISAAVMADDATLENGCLQMVSGAHKSGCYPHPGGGIPDDLTSKWDWIPVTGKAGEVVFFDSYVPHASDENVTDSSRRTYYLTYGLESEGDHRTGYYADKREHFPPDIERVPGKNYAKGGEVYNLGNPCSTTTE